MKMIFILAFILCVVVMTAGYLILARRAKAVTKMHQELLDEEYEYLDKRYGQYIRPANAFLRYKDLADFRTMMFYFWIPLKSLKPTKSLDEYYKDVQVEAAPFNLLELLGGDINEA
jgi:hypothetical protein